MSVYVRKTGWKWHLAAATWPYPPETLCGFYLYGMAETHEHSHAPARLCKTCAKKERGAP